MKTYVWKRDLETESPETRDGGQFPQFPRWATHERRVPERTLTPAPHARARPHRRTPGSSPPTRKAARRSLRCVDAERETQKGVCHHFIRHPGRRRRARSDFFSTTAISDPPTPRALRTSTDHGDATHEKRPTHTERAFGDAPRADAPRDAARKDFTREKRKASAQLDKKKARRARGRASPRAPRATEYKPNRTQKKKAKSRETNREPLPFRPSPLFAARRFSPIDERRDDRNSSP